MDYEVEEIDIEQLKQLQSESLLCKDYKRLKEIVQDTIAYNYKLTKKLNQVISSLKQK